MAQKNLKKIKVKKPQPKNAKVPVSGVGTTVPVPAAQTITKHPVNPGALDDLISSASEATEGQREFMSPQGAVRKKRGRPTKEESEAKAAEEPTEPPPPVFDSKPACEVGFQMFSGWFVRYTGEKRVALLPEEIENLSIAWGKVLDKHLPAILGEYAIEIAAVMVTGQVASRLYVLTSVIVAEKQAERARHMHAQGFRNPEAHSTGTVTDISPVN